ncbi:hypothetical protein ACQB6R_02970 [Propionibacteriaceae bacterium G1746]
MSERGVMAGFGVGARTTVLAALLAGATAVTATPALAQDRTITLNQPLALTGLAADPQRSVYWAVVDPTRPQIAAIGASGSYVGDMQLSEPVTSLQALASRGGVLYLGDIGDPTAARQSVTVLRVGRPFVGTVVPTEWTFTYADGPHDAAALAVSGRGNLYVVTRGQNPGIYRADGQPSAEATNTFVRVADAPQGVSDAVFLPDGTTLAMWGSAGLHLVDAVSFKTVALGPVPRTGEAITMGLEQQLLMLGTGGGQPRIVATPRPTGFASVTPSPSAAASPSAVQTTTAASPVPTTPDPANARTGTAAAIVGAGVLALAAGAVTFVPKRPKPRRRAD